MINSDFQLAHLQTCQLVDIIYSSNFTPEINLNRNILLAFLGRLPPPSLGHISPPSARPRSSVHLHNSHWPMSYHTHIVNNYPLTFTIHQINVLYIDYSHLQIKLAGIAKRPAVAVSTPEGGLRGAAVGADSCSHHLGGGGRHRGGGGGGDRGVDTDRGRCRGPG